MIIKRKTGSVAQIGDFYKCVKFEFSDKSLHTKNYPEQDIDRVLYF